MQVDVTYDDGNFVSFVLPDDISMIDACKQFATNGRVSKVEFPEPLTIKFGPLVRVVYKMADRLWEVHLQEQGVWQFYSWAHEKECAIRAAQKLRSRLLEGEANA